MDWLLRLKDKPQCHETADGLQAWLQHSEDNRAAWQAALRTWALLGEIKPQHADLWPARVTENVLPFRPGAAAAGPPALHLPLQPRLPRSSPPLPFSFVFRRTS